MRKHLAILIAALALLAGCGGDDGDDGDAASDEATTSATESDAGGEEPSDDGGEEPTEKLVGELPLFIDRDLGPDVDDALAALSKANPQLALEVAQGPLDASLGGQVYLSLCAGERLIWIVTPEYAAEVEDRAACEVESIQAELEAPVTIVYLPSDEMATSAAEQLAG